MATYTFNHPIFYNRLHSLSLPKLSLKLFWILGFVLVLSLSIFYVFQVNEITKETYLTKNYLKEIDSISQGNRILEINFAHTSYLGDIEKNVQTLNFEKVKKIKYIQILEGSLVTK